MAKTTTIFVCQGCGHQTPKWMGKCPECLSWNSLVEEASRQQSSLRNSKRSSNSSVLVPITEVQSIADNRLTTGIGEFDRVLGGGMVEGSLILIGGEPGIGKSTITLQSMGHLARLGKKVLYVSGEESGSQIKLRAERLNALSENLLVCSEICVEDILKWIDKVEPDVLVLDSVQTFYTADLQSAPGSIGQVREVAFKIFQAVKHRSIPTLLIGHINKDGAIAGPKSLEHIVDTVVYFEGERGHAYRALRATKNRFGPTPEIGVFQMAPEGLVPVENPSEWFLSERPENSSGSAIAATLEGSRTLLVEVQALVSTSSSIGMPRRMSTGFDHNRMSLLIAIMEKRMELNLQGEDIFVNLTGGIKITEPALDLAVAAAIAGSFQDKVIDPLTVLVGEVGLTGEVRSVMQLDARIIEAKRLGFKRCIIPHSAKNVKSLPDEGVELIFVKNLSEVFEHLF
ncbi:MAG: DNA repair protein RadA [Nitrospina sp.]|jgi:DNA repair protein RadA/Sms|nr:DNA repair protein RadA [Nitrospina sp.]MBT3509094.1 DNA repair protein RadA [Nitrospina sp.]MBT3876724.1 DNA repair protein RadA [Nitrospina sp.]MBT4047851.1 DNA repair protein RadA [Nitrospina sp.]MBT4558588.1 DNA repair protein RadA [Nitrospina sp.]